MAAKKPTTPKRRKDGQFYKSPVGKPQPVVDFTNWRQKVRNQNKIKLDDEAKEIFLSELASHGLRTVAADKANVSMACVRNHAENDPEFKHAWDQAVDAYRDKRVGKSMELAFDGIEVKKYNKDGDLVEEKREYPIRLIELELKRIEPGYREKQQVDLNHSGGVMVAPATMTPDQWIASQENASTDEDV